MLPGTWRGCTLTRPPRSSRVASDPTERPRAEPHVGVDEDEHLAAGRLRARRRTPTPSRSSPPAGVPTTRPSPRGSERCSGCRRPSRRPPPPPRPRCPTASAAAAGQLGRLVAGRHHDRHPPLDRRPEPHHPGQRPQQPEPERQPDHDQDDVDRAHPAPPARSGRRIPPHTGSDVGQNGSGRCNLTGWSSTVRPHGDADRGAPGAPARIDRGDRGRAGHPADAAAHLAARARPREHLRAVRRAGRGGRRPRPARARRRGTRCPTACARPATG